MTAEEEARYLWGLALVKDKNGKWRHSDFPVCRDAWPKFFNEWKRARTTKTVDGKPVTVQLVEQYYYAEARERKARRASGAFVPFPVGIKVHTGEQRWNNGLDVGREEEMEESKPKLCQCGQPTHGPNYDKCTTCMGYKDRKLVTPYAEEMRRYYANQDLNYKFISKIVKPGEVSKIMKIINIWSNTTHNAHVRKYNTLKYNQN